MGGIDLADVAPIDFSTVSEAELLSLEVRLRGHEPLTQFPARPCAECHEWFVPMGDEPNVFRCMDCEQKREVIE